MNTCIQKCDNVAFTSVGIFVYMYTEKNLKLASVYLYTKMEV